MANGRGSRPKACKACGIAGTADAPISFRGLCAPCAERRMTEAALGMMDRTSETFERWRQGMTRAGSS